ncbi:MAG: DUF4065 domain-containing protein [Gammaproteobacteria bacterium]|nr:DUF4065 domain-containing protein [Gammaproteobacteria bacterium]
MAINVLRTAKYMGEISDWSLSHLHLQKLLYLSHMFFLGQNAGEPLVQGHFEAWDYGPVHPELYHKAKIFGADPVKNIFRSCDDLEEGLERNTLDYVFTALRGVSGAQLVAMTHQEEGAWAKHYEPGRRGVIIPDDDILEEFESLKRKAGL